MKNMNIAKIEKLVKLETKRQIEMLTRIENELKRSTKYLLVMSRINLNDQHNLLHDHAMDVLNLRRDHYPYGTATDDHVLIYRNSFERLTSKIDAFTTHLNKTRTLIIAA